ncbi:hypothetical protein MVEN_02543500 [Mycena venus]|uniref:Uncharacterized protein n=1 Tax=Mycena venus TaxID=2733690 RepID=A0A8H6TZW8_9AGAR|nr:hypothetical protein MVEN_02543500 [Mycena venus]
MLSTTLPLGLWLLGSTGSCSEQSLRGDLPSQIWLDLQSLGVGCKAGLHGKNICDPIHSSAVILALCDSADAACIISAVSENMRQTAFGDITLEINDNCRPEWFALRSESKPY